MSAAPGTGAREAEALAESAAEWLARFAREHGRPLRVLHIGNIANNAYNNAKIQRQRGIEADVACWDYYHVMGCPEWEDAQFEGDVGDPFFPDWWGVDLHGFKRPRWFAQGTLRTTQRYLRARRRGSLGETLLWGRLESERWLFCRSTRGAAATGRLLLGAVALRRDLLLAGRYPPARAGLSRRWLPIWWARLALWELACTPSRLRFARLWLASAGRTAGRKSVAGSRALVAIGRGADWRTAALTVFPRRLAHLAPERGAVIGADGTPGARAVVTGVDDADAAAPTFAGADAALLAPPALGEDERGLGDPLVARYRELFPDRANPLTREDYEVYLGSTPRWRALFAEYDVVQAYATNPIIPLLGGWKRFAAYEHGTLRETPFEETELGRICALGYREAPVVFVTNSDVLESARRLGLDDDRLVFLPHAVDSDRLLTFGERNGSLLPKPDAEVVLFSPARQDWVDANPSLTKGNDRAIRALRLVFDSGRRCRLVLAAWGRDVDASRGLIAELGLEEHVSWIDALRKQALWEAYLGSHAVLDQFVLPALGGVAFEAMALGRRVITTLDLDTAERFFGARPPVLACSEPETIADAIACVIDDPLDERRAGAAAREWFARYHSADRIVELQALAYRRLLESA